MGDNQRHVLTYDEHKKSAGIAYILWLLFGGLGAHRFYLGDTQLGVAQLLLSFSGVVSALIGEGPLLLIPIVAWLILDVFLIRGSILEHNAYLAAMCGVESTLSHERKPL
ncbi:TM2 domain-containing protein [Paraburkholderia sp. MMS20-SJTR3]|uniref:TM2 domain-containing protein n=1 Tax=Paraburkholderia sejongensis TaxID=2886946 RepID=A0ABS8K3U6_9BURK|nr:TM2 domain-containing protein [Paraburkholderia sp. MMS20-SJTR3]MCC8396833.1 TM2 domain-containing protein [Paraburkholderia sp. MMS20-SJTR3]